MAYQVLARKWRPRDFHTMVGQTHVRRAITNALDHNRLHHAYLFTGTRGVGKTTIARIFAKSLNCETNGVSSTPCGTCAACIAIDQGRYVDLIEVDAASRTGVDDTRELLDNVQYAPTQGRFKVYLIDEVHMLTKQSFNALLKTLEEPPPHVKFLLATTDPQKLLPTVLSRCLQFNLKRIPPQLIVEHLQHILDTEEISYDAASLRLLAHAADGSMRDALSLLDQAIAYGAGELREAEVSSMLGTLDQHHIVDIVKSLAHSDAAMVLQQVAQLAESNPDYATVLADMLSLLQQIAVLQAVPGSVDDSRADAAVIQQLAEQLLPEDVQLFYQIALTGRRDLPLNPDPRGGFEMLLLRMLLFRPASSVVSNLPPPTASGTISTTTPHTASPTPQTTQTLPVVTTSTASESEKAQALPVVTITASPAEQLGNDAWSNLVRKLPLRGLTQQLALHCAYLTHDEQLWQLRLEPRFQTLLNKKGELEQALRDTLQQPTVRLDIQVNTDATTDTVATPAAQQQQARAQQRANLEQKIAQDPFVQALQQQYNAEIQKITPR